MPANIETQNPPGLLGALWLLYGIARIVAGVVLILYSGVATVMFGALLGRVPDPAFLMATFHFLYAIAIVVAFASGLFGIMAGLALVAKKSGTRGLSLIASILSLADLPLGTTLGTYTLILFLR